MKMHTEVQGLVGTFDVLLEKVGEKNESEYIRRLRSQI